MRPPGGQRNPGSGQKLQLGAGPLGGERVRACGLALPAPAEVRVAPRGVLWREGSWGCSSHAPLPSPGMVWVTWEVGQRLVPCPASRRLLKARLRVRPAVLKRGRRLGVGRKQNPSSIDFSADPVPSNPTSPYFKTK